MAFLVTSASTRARKLRLEIGYRAKIKFGGSLAPRKLNLDMISAPIYSVVKIG